MTRFDQILSLLHHGGVEFILIGGLAGIAHGHARATFDVDVVYRRSRENMRRLADTLAPIQPYLRGVPPGLPFKFDENTIRGGLNFTLQTALGDLDLMGEVPGGGSYEQLLAFVEPRIVFGLEIKVVTLSKLIHLKRAAGRPKDLEAIAELEALWEERQRLNNQSKPPLGG